MRYLVVAIILFAAIGLAAFPEPIGYVNDFAGVLPDAATLDAQVRAYEQDTTIEIAVVTISELPPDQSAATYANELFAEWGIGKKGEDNGILVLIIPNGTVGNRLRIELGYGIQGYITGAEAGRILDEALPAYLAGDYQSTADIIVAGLMRHLEGYVPGMIPDRGFDEEIFDSPFFLIFTWMPLWFFILAIILGLFYSGRCPYCKSRGITCTGDTCTCKKCGRTFRRSRAGGMAAAGAGWAAGGGGGFGGGGGGGGFGGGGSGGGGAGR